MSTWLVSLLIVLSVLCAIVLVAAAGARTEKRDGAISAALVAVILSYLFVFALGKDAFGEGRAETHLRVGTYHVLACTKYSTAPTGEVNDCILSNKANRRLRYLVPTKLDGSDVPVKAYPPGTKLEMYEMDDGLHVRTTLPAPKGATTAPTAKPEGPH